VLVVAGLVLFLANAIIRPIVIILTLPAVILTLGILLLFINAFTLWITEKIVPPFEVDGFWTYLGSVIIIWIVNMMVYAIFKPDRRESRELAA
jgi:putative membrane protein